MKAFTIDRYKSKDGGRIVDVPQPEVGDNDVLVQVHAAGVNLLDAKIADGEFKIFLPYRFPLVLGNDVAGVVAQVGSRVRRFKPVTRSMRDRIRIGSGPSRNSSQ
jgi:NADPH:quinone reductase-like Zn-dependent oxidoreductase